MSAAGRPRSGRWPGDRRRIGRQAAGPGTGRLSLGPGSSGAPRASAGPTGHRPRTRAAGPTRRLGVHELPLVVFRAPFVDADRGFLALAGHTHQPGSRTTALRRLQGRLQAGRSLRIGRLIALRALHAARRLPLTWPGWDTASVDRAEVLAGDGILVFLAEEFLLDEHVDVRRERTVLLVEQPDRPRVLLAAENQLGLLFPSHLVTPDGKRGRQQDRHDREHRQQRGHRVARIAARAGRTAGGERRLTL